MPCRSWFWWFSMTKQLKNAVLLQWISKTHNTSSVFAAFFTTVVLLSARKTPSQSNHSCQKTINYKDNLVNQWKLKVHEAKTKQETLLRSQDYIWFYLCLVKAGVHLNLIEILGSLKRDWKGAKRLWNTTRQLPDPTMAPQVFGQLFGVYQPIFNFKL